MKSCEENEVYRVLFYRYQKDIIGTATNEVSFIYQNMGQLEDLRRPEASQKFGNPRLPTPPHPSPTHKHTQKG